MKKVLLTMMVAFVAFAATAQRNVDLSVKLNDPNASTLLRAGVAFPISFTYKNNGPDTLKGGDSMQFGVVINNTLITQTIKTVIINAGAKVKPGDTGVVNYPPTLALNGPSGTVNVCAFALIRNRTIGDSLHETNNLNNVGCNATAYTGMGDGKVEVVYGTQAIALPNPANQNTTISYQLASNSKVSLSILDITGKQIELISEGIQPAGKYGYLYNTSNLKNGVYMYKLTVDGATTSGKLVVTH